MTILEILDEFGVDYRQHGEHEHCGEGWVQTQCTLCSPNGNFRLGFSLTSNGCSCWSCGKQSAGFMLSQLINKPSKECWTLLGQVEHQVHNKKPRGKLVMPTHCQQLSPAHRRYLEGRGLDPDEVIKLWKVQGTKEDSNYPWSIVIPVHLNGEVVSFTTRKLHNNGPRYKSAKPEEERVSLKEILFGIDKVGTAAIVVEGPLDAITIGPGAVATFGLSFTNTQVRMLGKVFRRVICYDNEIEAQKKAMNLAHRLALYQGETFIIELDSADPGEATSEEVAKLRSYLI